MAHAISLGRLQGNAEFVRFWLEVKVACSYAHQTLLGQHIPFTGDRRLLGLSGS